MWVISYTFSSNPFTKPSSSPGPADSTNHCLPLSHMPNHISIHFSASSKPPPLGRLSSSAQSTGTTSSQASPVYPSGCNQRDLSKVKWVQGLFFFKSLQMSYHWLWYFKALHYWSHLFSSASLLTTLPSWTLCFSTPKFSLLPKCVHSFTSLHLCAVSSRMTFHIFSV